VTQTVARSPDFELPSHSGCANLVSCFTILLCRAAASRHRSATSFVASFASTSGGYPLLAEGIFLRIWRSGPQAGEPKLPPAVKTMIARGLAEVRRDGPWVRAYFTTTGFAALRELAANRRYLDPVRYVHMRRELGLEAEEGNTSSSG
jgi:hypothetical protein